MNETVNITSDMPVLDKLGFKAYRTSVERHVKRFMPAPDEPQEINLVTPWGETLTAQRGDYLVSEINAPDDIWPVEAAIFEQTYTILRPGVCVKSALTYLAPLTELTEGDPDRKVTLNTLEGAETVRAGDFYLARGVKGEIWAYPIEKIGKMLVPAE